MRRSKIPGTVPRLPNSAIWSSSEASGFTAANKAIRTQRVSSSTDHVPMKSRRYRPTRASSSETSRLISGSTIAIRCHARACPPKSRMSSSRCDHLPGARRRTTRVKPLPNVSVELVNAALLKEFAVVKLKGFGNTEDQPSVGRVAQEVASREAELRGSGRCMLARAGEEPAAIIGYFEGNDRLAINLATRVPFRNTGVARLLLTTVLMDAYERRCRSVNINTNPADTPINWYRRLGFTDQVYWHRSYLYRPIR